MSEWIQWLTERGDCWKHNWVRHNCIVSSVRARLSSQQGISFTEFTYQLLQAYDFHYLHKHHGCSIQIGGSDQWGNIVAGLELIGRLEPPLSHEQSVPEAYGITTPLLTTSSGEKFGKSAGNAIWLESNLTSIFDFYQVLVRLLDIFFLRVLQVFPQSHRCRRRKISQIVYFNAPEWHRGSSCGSCGTWDECIDPGSKPHFYVDSTRKTESATPSCRRSDGIGPYKFVFGKLVCKTEIILALETGTLQAATMSSLLFGSGYADLKFEDIVTSFGDDPRLVKISKVEMLDTPITKLASRHGLASSTCKNTLVSVRCKLPVDLIQSCFACSCCGKGLISKQYPYSGPTFPNRSRWSAGPQDRCLACRKGQNSCVGIHWLDNDYRSLKGSHSQISHDLLGIVA